MRDFPIDDAYNKIILSVFGEMFARGILPETLMECISTAVGAEPDMTSDEKRTMVCVAGQVNRMLQLAYNVHCDDVEDQLRRMIDGACDDEPPYSYTEHMEDES